MNTLIEKQHKSIPHENPTENNAILDNRHVVVNRYTAGQVKKLANDILDRSNDALISIDFQNTAAAGQNDPDVIEEWLRLHDMADLIDPHRRNYTCPCGRPRQTPAAADPQPAPAEDQQEQPARSDEPEPQKPYQGTITADKEDAAGTQEPITAPHLEDHLHQVLDHINRISDDNKRAEFIAALNNIVFDYPKNRDDQDDAILSLSARVIDYEQQQATATTQEPEKIELDIIDGDTVMDGKTGKLLDPETAKKEIEAEQTRKKILEISALNKEVIPPYNRTEPIRDYKHPILVSADGTSRPNPAFISPDPKAKRYVLNTLNHTDLSIRCAEELRGEVINNAHTDVQGTKEPVPHWMIWDKTAYKHDRELFNKSIVFAIDTLHHEAVYLSETNADPKVIGSLLKFINTSKNSKNITAVLNEMKDKPGMTKDFNTAGSQDLICLQNVIFNTATGEIIKATDTARINEIKHQLPYHYIDRPYNPIAEPTEYLKMVYTFFYDNTTPGLSDEERDKRAKEGAAWYIRYRGYVLFSGNPEGVNLFLIGPAHNGKTTLARASGGPLNDEFGELTDVSEIYASHTGPLESYTKLAPKREALIDEGAGNEEKGQRLGSNFFKSTTTTRSIRSRGLYQSVTSTPHNLKRTFSMNEAPHFDINDEGILRRMVVPPCNHHYTEKEKINDYDKYLIEKEGDAILSLMVRECIHYINGNQDAPEGSPGRNPGLLPIPAHWAEYKADVLGGSVYTSFLQTYFEPITNPAEKTQANKVTRGELYKLLISYTKAHHCIDDLGQLAISNETTTTNDGYTIQEKTLNKAAAKQLRVALIELGFGDYTSGKHDNGVAYIYAKWIFPNDRPTFSY